MKSPNAPANDNADKGPLHDLAGGPSLLAAMLVVSATFDPTDPHPVKPR